MQHILYISARTLLALALALSASAAFAWTPPTASPPNNNVAAPINVGDTDQEKEVGWLGLKDSGLWFENEFQNDIMFNTTDDDNWARIKFEEENFSFDGCDEDWNDCGSLFGVDFNDWEAWVDGELWVSDDIGTGGSVQAQRYYDDNSSYFVDSNVTSQMNSILVNGRITDWGTGYYLDISGTNRLGYGLFDNVHAYGVTSAGSYMSAPDYWISNTGQWASQVGSGGGGSGDGHGHFGGLFLRVNGNCDDTNPMTGNCNCPGWAGGEKTYGQFTDPGNSHESLTLHLCYRNGIGN